MKNIKKESCEFAIAITIIRIIYEISLVVLLGYSLTSFLTNLQFQGYVFGTGYVVFRCFDILAFVSAIKEISYE